MIAMLLAGTTAPALANEQFVDTTKTAEITLEVVGEPSDKDVSLVIESVDTADIVDEKLNAYISKIKRKLADDQKENSVFLYQGTAAIEVDKNNPRWSKFRERALDAAILDARKSYLQTLNSSVKNNEISSTAANNGLPKPSVNDFRTDSKVAAYVNKVVAVLDGKLDTELVEMGIDPKQYKEAPPSVKRELYKESIVNQTVRSSYGDLSGMMLIKVYEEIKESGKGTLGVVLALSADKRDQVKAMIDSNGEVAPDPTKANASSTSIYNMFASQKDSLYLKSGTRVLHDAEGYPMIVSYGQSGVTHSASAAKRKIERKIANNFAINNAWANFARTYNLNGDLKNKTSIETQTSENEKFELIVDSVRSTNSGLTQNLIESMEERAALTSSISSLTGVGVEFEWRRKHPVTGHEMVGVVLVWHPKKIISAKNMVSGKKHVQPAKKIVSDGAVSSAESEDMFNVADF